MKFHLRWHRSRPESVQPVFHRDWPKKQDYPCCAATRDAYNRLCIGDCGPDCLRRAARRSA